MQNPFGAGIPEGIAEYYFLHLPAPAACAFFLAANQMNGEIHDGRRHCSVYPSFAIFSIRDKGMEEKLQCHKDVMFGLQGRKYI